MKINTNKPTSRIRITTVEPMKCAALLNISPPSFAQIQAFKPTCTIKKRMRKIPVKAITNFLPIEEVKTCFQVILTRLYVKKSLQKYITNVSLRPFVKFISEFLHYCNKYTSGYIVCLTFFSMPERCTL